MMEVMPVFERENAFYSAHQTEFQEKYLKKWLVIAGESLLGAYNTPKEAIQNALEHYAPGEFMVHTPARDGMVIEIGPYIHTQSLDDDDWSDAVITYSGGDPVAIPYA